MFDLDKWAEIYATVRKHKLRTGLTAFGVFWGIFMLVLLLGAGKGLENGVVQNFNVAKNAVFVWSQRTSVPHQGLKAGRFIQLTNDDVRAIRNEIPEIEIIAPRSQLGGNFVVSYGTKNSSFSVQGDYPDYVRIEPVPIKTGRFLNDIDIADKRKVAVVGERVVEVLFGEEDPIGKYINIKGSYFQVVGVFRPEGKGEQVMNRSQIVYIPITALQQTFNQVNKVGHFAFLPKPGVPAGVVEEKVKALLARRHRVAPEDVRAFGSNNVEENFKDVQGLFLGISLFSWIVSIGTILAGVIGVGNIMLIVVKERTKEIGIRKALGATPWSIISLVIQESIVITAAAGYLGLLAGTGLVAFINYLMKKFEAEGEFFTNPEVNLPVALAAMLLLVFTGALAGLIPAAKAANINPVVALRDE
jgi:putative ABC transport system permease protein